MASVIDTQNLGSKVVVILCGIPVCAIKWLIAIFIDISVDNR
jgi:hypothetical protein